MPQILLEEFRTRCINNGIQLKKAKRSNTKWEDSVVEILDELVKIKGARATISKIYHDYLSTAKNKKVKGTANYEKNNH